MLATKPELVSARCAGRCRRSGPHRIYRTRYPSNTLSSSLGASLFWKRRVFCFHPHNTMDTAANSDFQSLLDSADQPANLPDPKPGMNLTGKIVEINPDQGLVLNLGLKRDGLLPKAGLDQLT